MSWLNKVVADFEKSMESLSFHEKIPYGFLEEIQNSIVKNKALQKFELGAPSISQALTELSENSIVCKFMLNGLSGDFYICTSYEVIQKICSKHISEENSTDVEFLNSFFKFLMLETIFSISHMPFFKKYCPTLLNIETVKTSEINMEETVNMTLPCSFKDLSIPLIFVFSKKFQSSWSTFWSKSQFSKEYRNKTLSGQSAIISVEAAKTTISVDEMESLSTGDWIYLYESGFDEKSEITQVSLCIDGERVFSGSFDGKKVSVKSAL